MNRSLCRGKSRIDKCIYSYQRDKSNYYTLCRRDYIRIRSGKFISRYSLREITTSEISDREKLYLENFIFFFFFILFFKKEKNDAMTIVRFCAPTGETSVKRDNCFVTLIVSSDGIACVFFSDSSREFTNFCERCITSRGDTRDLTCTNRSSRGWREVKFAL